MKVLVFGSTIASTDRQIFCGGKGLNQAIAFAKYGQDTWQAGAVGTRRCADASGYVASGRRSYRID